MSDKLLTLVVTGRNDDYMGNFKYRLYTCINYVARNAARLGRLDDLEVCVTDWGSEVPLAAVLPLSPEAASITVFHYVPPSVTRAARSDGDFYPSCAINTSVRRARGEFTMLFDADSLFPQHALAGLFDLLDGRMPLPYDVRRTFFFLRRHQVPWEVVQRLPPLDEWDRFLLLTGGPLPVEESLTGLAGSGAGHLMHTWIWHEARGYNEQLVGQRWIDAEYALRITQRYPWIDTEALGITLYHMEHWPRNRRGLWTNRVLNRLLVSADASPNTDHWGLAAKPVQTLCADPQCVPAPRIVHAPLQFGAEVRRHVRSQMQSLRLSQREWEACIALSAHTLLRYTRRIVHIGPHLGNVAASVCSANPGIELYVVHAWTSDILLDSPAHFAAMLRRCGHRGYVRFITGDSAAGWEQLQADAFTVAQIDAACVNLDGLPEGRRYVLETAAFLSAGGMLVVTAPSPKVLPPVCSDLQALRPHWNYLISTSGQTLVVIADRNDLGEVRRFDFGRPCPPLLSTLVRHGARIALRIWREPRLLLQAVKWIFRWRARSRE